MAKIAKNPGFSIARVESISKIVSTHSIYNHKIVCRALQDGRLFWTITPIHSCRIFCFGKVETAEWFAAKYSNNHTYRYWVKVWNDYPYSHFDIFCEKL